MMPKNFSKNSFKRLKSPQQVCGKIEMDFASGEGLRFKDTCFNQRDMKDIGKILKKNADFIEYIFCLMMKTQENLQKDLKLLMKQEQWQTPF